MAHDEDDTAAAPVRHGARAQKAMTKIMDAAERLFARYGIEGVALRQILIEAKQKNKYAVSLYFGSKEDLVVAVLERRVAEMNIRRDALVAKARAAGQENDIRALLEIMHRPAAEVADATGDYSYPRFLLQLQLHKELNAPWLSIPGELSAPTLDVVRKLRKFAPKMPGELAQARIGSISGMWLTSVTARGFQISKGVPVPPFDVFMDDLVGMMAAALQAPAMVTKKNAARVKGAPSAGKQRA